MATRTMLGSGFGRLGYGESFGGVVEEGLYAAVVFRRNRKHLSDAKLVEFRGEGISSLRVALVDYQGDR